MSWKTILPLQYILSIGYVKNHRPNITAFTPTKKVLKGCKFVLYLEPLLMVLEKMSSIKGNFFGSFRTFNGSQLAKMKKQIPYMSLPWNL